MKKGTALIKIRQMLGHLGHVQRQEQVCSVGTCSPLHHGYDEYGVGTTWEEALASAQVTKEALL